MCQIATITTSRERRIQEDDDDGLRNPTVPARQSNVPSWGLFAGGREGTSGETAAASGALISSRADGLSCNQSLDVPISNLVPLGRLLVKDKIQHSTVVGYSQSRIVRLSCTHVKVFALDSALLVWNFLPQV